MARIEKIIARELLDSRGRPTVEAEMICDDGSCGRAIVPSGASTGRAEALELRDSEAKRYDGLGVRTAIKNIEQIIAPELLGQDPVEQAEIDRRLLALDDTPRKTRLGGNALLAVSLATAHLAAGQKRVPLFEHLNDLMSVLPATAMTETGEACVPRMPLPMVNMISGGLHAGGNLDFQDILISPAGATTYSTGLEWIVRVYRRLGTLLEKAGYESHLVGDEGGYGPRLESNRQAVQLVTHAIEAAELTPGEDVTIALDVAASHFFDGEFYRMQATGDRQLTSEAMIDELESLVEGYPIASIEDGLAEEDWSGWQKLNARLGDRIQIVGDDLLTTNVKRVQRAIRENVANALLVKVNQIGTLSEAIETMRVARSAGYRLVVSARSGETEDTTIADLAVGVAAEQIKIGSIVRSERLAKYNQLLRIEPSVSTLFGNHL